jgi:predicted Zn-dependent peptidase
VNRPGSYQSEIRVGHIGITRASERYFAATVLTQIFGGSFGSRLNESLRVQKGLTYGVSGGFSTSRFAGTFSVRTFSKTPSTAQAVQAILDEISKLRTSVPTESEMDISRSYLVGSFEGNHETPQALVSDLWTIEEQTLPKNYYSRYLTAVAETKSEDILEMAKTFVDPEHLTLVVVGEAERIKEDLEKIAPVTVIEERKASEGKEPEK